MNKALRITIFSGVFAGISVELMRVFFEFSGLFSIVGPLAGSTFGYLLYELDELFTAIRSTWRQVIGWRPDWELWKYRVVAFRYYLMVYSTVFTVGVVFLLTPLMFDMSQESEFVLFLLLGGSSIFVAGLSSLCLAFFSFSSEQSSYERKRKTVRIGRLARVSNIYVHTLKVVRFIKGIPSVLKLFRHVPGVVARTVGAFVREVYIRIHSEARLIVFICSFAGALIGGYDFQSVVVGIFAGALVGALDVIVSRLVLKVEVA